MVGKPVTVFVFRRRFDVICWKDSYDALYESWQQEELITQEARRGTLMSDWLPASHVRAKVIDFARLSTSRS